MDSVTDIPRPPESLRTTLSDLSKATSEIQLRRYARGEILYQQGEPAAVLYYLIKGRARTFVVTQDGREKTLLIIGPGDFLNDAAFFLQREQPTTAEALDRYVEAYRMSQGAVNCLLESVPGMARFLLESLARKTSLLIGDLADQSFQDVRGRVQLALIQLAQQHGIAVADGIRIELRVTHEVIASLVGANRSHVSTCLSALQHEGFYQVIDQRIVLAPWAIGQQLPP